MLPPDDFTPRQNSSIEPDNSFFRKFFIGGLIAGILGLVINVAFVVCVLIALYFFCAAAGIVPPLDLIPFIPYV